MPDTTLSFLCGESRMKYTGAPGVNRDTRGQVALPLKDRSLRAYPHLYRLNGGDRAGWSSIGCGGALTRPTRRLWSFVHEHNSLQGISV